MAGLYGSWARYPGPHAQEEPEKVEEPDIYHDAWKTIHSVQKSLIAPFWGFSIIPTSLAERNPSTDSYGPSQPPIISTESDPPTLRQPFAKRNPEDELELEELIRQPETEPKDEPERVRRNIAMVKLVARLKATANFWANKEQLQDLAERHKPDNMEFYDLFVKLHPSAGAIVRKLAAKRATPWRPSKHDTKFSSLDDYKAEGSIWKQRDTIAGKLSSSHGSSPRPSKHDTSFSSLKDYKVEGQIGKQRVDALADTGAQSNFISQQFVEKLGIVPHDRISRSIQLPGGKQVLSRGTVKVPFSFCGEVKKYLLDCLIIPGCTNELILSGAFLRTTKTLTTFKSRIKETIRQIKKSTLRLSLLGNERQRLWGSLNNRSALALSDTGSDVMLVSAEFAKENKFKIDHDPQHRLELELADGSTIFTTGVVRDAMWKFGDSSQSVYCDLYVLNGLTVDVVLNNSFIFELDVFSKFSHFMINLDSLPDLSEFYNVRLISKYSAELTRLEEESINDMSSPHARKAERVRRDRIRDAINALNAAQQIEAWQAEAQRRLIWDRHYEYTVRNLPQVDSQDSSKFKPRWWERTLGWWSEGWSIRRGA